MGGVLFSTAMNMFDATLGNHVAAERVSTVLEEPRDSTVVEQARVDWVLDEVFDPPKPFVSSQSFPHEATAAIRSGPRQDSELLGCIACGSVVLATGTCGNYIQCKVAETLGRASTDLGFVLRQLDGLPLFSPAPPTQQTFDECFDPVKIFVCAPSFPKTSSAAVRTAPTPNSELLTTLPFGSEVQATARAGSYLQIRLTDSAAAEGGSCLAWVPRVLGDLVLFVEQQAVKPADAERSLSLSTEAAICEQTNQISRFQQWWADGHGDAAAAAHSILSLVDRSVLQEVVSTGANYHNCLSADRLDGLQRMVDKSRRPGLEALRRALLTKGGAKSQARAVGTVLFKEAFTIFNSPKHDAGDQPTESMGDLPCAEVDKTPINEIHREVMLDEIYNPPKRFVCSDAFPKDATVAVRVVPDMAGELVTSLPHGAEILATGSRNSYLQFKLEDAAAEGGSRLAWVPRLLGDLVLFVEQQAVKPTDAEEGPASLSTEAAICEQTNQISRFQQWWAEGHGDAAAAAHSILSLVDRSVLHEVVSTGANYHNCLSADRLDGLQRMVDKSRRPGLEALRRALLTKGGAKSQARAVGTVLFKEALTIFNSPKHDAGDQPTESMGDLPCAEVDTTPINEIHREVMLDEIYNPPKRFVCSDAFPKDATVAVRVVPDMAGELVTSLPHGAEILATGSRNSYLQFKLEDAAAEGGSRLAWVPRLLGDLVLFVEQQAVKPADAEEGAASLSTEAAICEQTNQISRFQQWWADGHGDAAAAAHSILSLVDRSVLHEVVSTGANYHNCLSADRLDGLQRMVDKYRRPGLEALRRALLTKGGAKSQARAVGTVLFKEALTIFNSPKHDAGDQPTESMGDLPCAEVDKTPTNEIHREVMLDEIYNPPKRFVCSDAFPKDATVAVRASPTQQSEFLTCLPFGTDAW